jgi:predicted transcriptional regulator
VKSLKVIEKVAEKIAPGRTPLFTEAHVIKALEEIKSQGYVGRIKLSKELGLGEGTTRTLIKHLKKEKLIKISRYGIELSEHGKKLFSTLRAEISKEIEIPSSPLTVDTFNIAVLVRDAGSAVKYGLEQRDAAIMTGAHGATTLIFSKNKLTMPGVTEDIFKDNPSIRDTLLSKLKPKENDVIIIGSAEDRRVAELGAKMAAFELLKSRTDGGDRIDGGGWP